MKFLVDAQLPQKLADYLNKKGLDSLHTLQLPDRNRSTDEFICQMADSEQRCLITKDKDFWHSYFLKNTPKKFLIVRTGNLDNDALLDIFENHIEKICEFLQEYSLIEINSLGIIAHK